MLITLLAMNFFLNLDGVMDGGFTINSLNTNSGKNIS